jgi:dTDP-L-rhamnose 4-epimerase
MKILVTGGAGFVGSHLVDGLIAAGHEVRIIDALVDQVHRGRVPAYLNRHAEFVHADLNDRAEVSNALDGVEAVFHEAAKVGIAQSMYEIYRYVRGNDLGTAVLLEEIVKRRDRIRKLVVASSHSVYGEGAYRCRSCGVVTFPSVRSPERLRDKFWEYRCDVCGDELLSIATPETKPACPTSVYAINKQNHEQYCLTIGKAYKIPTVAFRYFNIYGPRQAVSNPYTGVCAIFSARLLNERSPLVYEDGRQTRDFIHVSDVVAANLKVLDSPSADNQVLNLGTGRATSIAEIAKMLAAGLRQPIEPEVSGNYREGDIRHCVADISKIREALSFEPKVRLENGLRELVGWLATQDAVDGTDSAAAELAARRLVS